MFIAPTLLAAALSLFSCPAPEADAALQQALAARTAGNAAAVDDGLTRCLAAAPGCPACLYESGRVAAGRKRTDEARRQFQAALRALPGNTTVLKALAALKPAKESPTPPGRVAIGTRGVGAGPVQMELVARFQNYNARPAHPADHFDPHINSPKSVRFSADGTRVWVNSLEGGETVVFDPRALRRTGVISHNFTPDKAPLFRGETTVFGYPYLSKLPAGGANVMMGKPVESELSHGERYLWVPYYRRSFDAKSASPSAVAIIDAATQSILRVMPTGPIPKYVAASPDSRWVAVTHWGDNTLGVIDTSGGTPESFRYAGQRLVVEHALPMENLSGSDRDSDCGKCLRGTVFTPDGRTLLVARMGDGGVAGFEVGTWRYLGTITGEPHSPRHLVVTRDGRWLYLSSNRSGSVSRIALEDAVAALRAAGGRKVVTRGWETVAVGGGTRTIELSPDERFVYAASNLLSEVVVIRADTPRMQVIHRVRTDNFTVGLAVSPDGKQVWTTSQGRDNEGGNSVCVYKVETK